MPDIRNCDMKKTNGVCAHVRVCECECVQRVRYIRRSGGANHANRGGKEFEAENGIFTYCLQKMALDKSSIQLSKSRVGKFHLPSVSIKTF